MITFKEWMLEKELNEVTKKFPANVKWKSGFGSGIGKFSINVNDEIEHYEIEFDEFEQNNKNIAGIKFFRMNDNLRITKYTESKDPMTVSLTIKEQTKLYLEKKKPDLFGFVGKLTEKGRLRHYARMLETLSSEYTIYKHTYTMD